MPSRSKSGREVEIKLKVRDVDHLVGNLRRLGAKPQGRVFEQNTLYDTPDGALRRRGRMLRIRVEAPAPSAFFPGGWYRAAVTCKSPVPVASTSRYKEKIEREITIRSPRHWAEILQSMGFRPVFRYEKYRVALHVTRLDLELDLDETPAGTFLELEGAPHDIDWVARHLGYSRRAYIRATYWDVYAAECRRRGRIPQNMVFHRQKT